MQTYRNEWEVEDGGQSPNFFILVGTCTFLCLKGAVGEGGQDSNCIQIVLSFPTSSYWQVWLYPQLSSPAPPNCGPYIHPPRSNLTQCWIIGTSREQGEMGTECESPPTPAAGRSSETAAEVTGRELALCPGTQWQVCRQNDDLIFWCCQSKGPKPKYSLTGKRRTKWKPSTRPGQEKGGGSRNRYLIVELDCKWKKESQNSHSASLKELTLCLCISVGCQMEKCKWDTQLLNQCLFDKVSARKTGFSLKCRKRLWIAAYKQWQHICTLPTLPISPSLYCRSNPALHRGSSRSSVTSPLRHRVGRAHCSQ